MSWHDDQIGAALAETRNMLADSLGLPRDRATRGESPVWKEIWPAVAEAPRCEHLHARPVQPWVMVLADRTWRCRPCSIAWGRDRQQRGLTFGPLEEWTCDRCRHLVPPVDGALEMFLIRQDLWMVVAGVCSRCRVELTSQGARRVTVGAHRPGRNDPCPCRSGKKSKRCCDDRTRP